MDPLVIDAFCASFELRTLPAPPELPDSVQMPPLDATRYDRALTHPLLVALEQRVSVDQSRQRDRDGSRRASNSALPPASTDLASLTAALINRDVGHDAERAARTATAVAASEVAAEAAATAALVAEYGADSLADDLTAFQASTSNNNVANALRGSASNVDEVQRAEASAEEAMTARAVQFARSSNAAAAAAQSAGDTLSACIELVLSTMTASVDEIRPPATLLAQNATHDDASKVALAQLLKNKLLPRGSDGDAVAVESRFAAVNQRASDLLLMAVQQQQQHALPDAPATIPEETTEQTDSQSEPAFSPAEQLAAAVNIPLTKSEPLAGPADAALALRSVINVASTTLRNKQWAALRQRLIQDGLPTSVLDRLAISIGAHAAGVHAMMNQVFRASSSPHAVEAVAALWKLLIALLEQCQISLDEVPIHADSLNDRADSVLNVQERADQSKHNLPSALETSGYETRIQRAEREHRVYTLRQARTQKSEVRSLEHEEKKLSTRVMMLRGMADTVESATRVAAERQLTANDELRSHEQIAAALDASVKALQASVTQWRERYHARANLFNSRKADFDVSSSRLTASKRLRLEVQELLTAARQDNEGHSARLLTATTQLDELNHACRSYKRQIAAAKETIADGSEWNDKAHEQLQIASLRNAPLYQHHRHAVSLREAAAKRFKETLDTGNRLKKLAIALADRLNAMETTTEAVEEKIENLRVQIETTKEMIGKASVQLEETMAMLQDKESDLQALKTAHETLRKILRRQTDDAKHKADELVAFAPQLQQCAAESGTLLQEYRVLHRHLKSEKAELKRVTQTAKIKQAQYRALSAIVSRELIARHRNQSQFEVWRRRCERLLEREMGLLSEVQQQTADVQAEVLRVQKDRDSLNSKVHALHAGGQKMKEETTVSRKEELHLAGELRAARVQAASMQEAAAVAAEKAYSTKVKIEIGEEAIKVANEQIDRDTAAGTELRESAKQQLDTAAATEKQQAARLAALLTRKESMHAEHNEVMEMLRQQQRALDPASERQLQENAQREAEIQTLTRRRDALFARVRHDEAATARLDKVVARLRAQREVGNDTQTKLQSSLDQAAAAASGVERAIDLARAVLVRREMVWRRQRERLHSDSHQLVASEGLLTYLRIEREAVAQHANKLRAPKDKHDEEISAIPERRSHGNQYNYEEAVRLATDPRRTIAPRKNKRQNK